MPFSLWVHFVHYVQTASRSSIAASFSKQIIKCRSNSIVLLRNHDVNTLHKSEELRRAVTVVLNSLHIGCC
jgi:hypothetical protein